MIQKTVRLFKKQIEFYYSKEREVLLDAGIGQGKTKIGVFWLATMVLKHPGTRWIMGARDSGQLRNATAYEMDKVLYEWMGLIEGRDYIKVLSPQMEYRFHNKSLIIGVGAHNYDSVFRGPSVSGMLGDEVDYWKEDAYKAAKGRVRVYPELIRWVSSPKGFNFIWEDFYQNPSSFRKVINASTYDNPLLSPEYIESLRSSYSPKLFEQEVLGKRLNLAVGAVYDEFKRGIHVSDCKKLLRPGDQLYFFTDYNISHYCGTYMFKRDGIIYAWGEEHLQFEGTKVMAQKIKAKFPTRPIIVIGDSTGNNKRDVHATHTNYQIFQQYGLLTKHSVNPPVQSRIINSNSILYHKRTVIDPSCKNLIRDLELVSWLENGKDIDKSDITLTHSSDGYTYGLWYFNPLQKPTERVYSTLR